LNITPTAKLGSGAYGVVYKSKKKNKHELKKKHTINTQLMETKE